MAKAADNKAQCNQDRTSMREIARVHGGHVMATFKPTVKGICDES